jgi:phenylpyruvate tautomerase PptA (4-oxalocrotonate tautomerase family)
MPLVDISLIKGKPPTYIRAIADGVHRALTEAYAAPANDRFQLILQVDRDELIYDPDYLGIHRSEDIVIVHIVAGNWRDTATKQAFYRRVVELLAENPGLRREDVQIVLSPNQSDDWSFGNGIASYVKE